MIQRIEDYKQCFTFHSVSVNLYLIMLRFILIFYNSINQPRTQLLPKRLYFYYIQSSKHYIIDFIPILLSEMPNHFCKDQQNREHMHCFLPTYCYATVFLFYFKIIPLCSSIGSSAFSDHCMNGNGQGKVFQERGEFGEFLAGASDRRPAVWEAILLHMVKCSHSSPCPELELQAEIQYTAPAVKWTVKYLYM